MSIDETRKAYEAAKAERRKLTRLTADIRFEEAADAHILALEAELDAAVQRAEAERDTRIQWGRERQDALDQLRWRQADNAALRAALEEIAELPNGGDSDRWLDDCHIIAAAALAAGAQEAE